MRSIIWIHTHTHTHIKSVVFFRFMLSVVFFFLLNFFFWGLNCGKKNKNTKWIQQIYNLISIDNGHCVNWDKDYLHHVTHTKHLHKNEQRLKKRERHGKKTIHSYSKSLVDAIFAFFILHFHYIHLNGQSKKAKDKVWNINYIS